MDTLVTFVTTNKRGQPVRNPRRVSGGTLTIGRGTQCQIQLPDPRVLLEHAKIFVLGNESVIEAGTGRILVNGRAVNGQRLHPKDVIDVGPYRIEVEAPLPDVPLVLTVTPSAQLAAEAGAPASSLLLRGPRISKRRLSYLGFFTALLLFLVMPIALDMLEGRQLPSVVEKHRSDWMPAVYVLSNQLMQSWDPGPLAKAHQGTQKNCHACHQIPFVQVRDFGCIKCHSGIKEHVPKTELTSAEGRKFAEQRCAECHRDHKGVNMAPQAQELCADCHRDVHKVAEKALSGNVTDFASMHPEFRLSLVEPGKPPAVRRIRMGGKEPIVERSNLKFNHALHLDPAGVRGVAGRKLLDCGSCHEPDDTGRLIAPVSMERHCKECHSLAFEPAVTDRQVPHGDEAAIRTMLQEFYARLMLGNIPDGVTPPADMPRMRPGAVLTPEDRSRALAIADRKAAQVMRELYQTRGVCGTCHEVTRTEEAAGKVRWEVAPIYLTRVWMPQARFTHAKHQSMSCSGCHSVDRSTKSSDVAMPDLRSCRECHVGAQPVEGKVTSDCATCHKFHDGRDYWHGEMQAQLRARRAN